MKIQEKIWKTEYQGMPIEVINRWNFQETSEEIRINGKTLHQSTLLIAAQSGKSLMGKRFDWEENGTAITVKMGSAWHMLGVACQILVNGKFHYGNRIVLFAGKQA